MTQALLALVGSGEYLPGMEVVDRQLLSQTGVSGRPANVVCIPAAAGQEGPESVQRWLRLGLEHFNRLGASPRPVRIVDRASADNPAWTTLIAAADLIYFSGGDPVYLHHCLAGSRAWEAVEAARARGAIVAGCSAGAMILGRCMPDVAAEELDLRPGFGWLPAELVLPHFDLLEVYRPGATELLMSRLPAGAFALGIDENTALVGAPGGAWQVQGARTASVLTRAGAQVFPAGATLSLPAPAA